MDLPVLLLVLIAALIGRGLLGERLSRFRWLGVVVTVAGLVMARL